MIMDLFRRVFGRNTHDEVLRQVEVTDRQTAIVTSRLEQIAITPNPITKEQDPFGALVHAMRGTYHRRRIRRDGYTGVPE